MRRVISFSADAAKPEFMWLPIAAANSLEKLDVEGLLGNCVPHSMVINQNTITGAPADSIVRLCYDDDFQAKYPNDNAAVLAATNRKNAYRWSGPLVAYANHIGDMDMTSYSDVVAFLIGYYNETDQHELRKGPKIPGVKAHCFGEMRLRSTPPFQDVLVPRMHPVFDNGEISEVSQKVGMPLLLLQDVKKEDPDRKSGDFCNPPLTFMMMGCDPKAESFGWAELGWSGGEVPNVLIVRQDREPLLSHEVEAFGDYCQNFLADKFQQYMEDASAAADNSLKLQSLVRGMMSNITPEVWEKRLEDWEATHA